MPQGVLPYKYEEEKSDGGMTALAGLPVYLDLACMFNLGATIGNYLHIKTQGWTDQQIIMALILLNIAGGESVDDLRILEADVGLCRILERSELKGLKRKERRETQRRWRKEKHRSVPSPSAVFRYLAVFHEDCVREKGKAVIPPVTELLHALQFVNRDLIAAIHAHRPVRCATLDMDATLIATCKKDALFSYKGYKAYQPLNTYWAEHGLILHTEFRDGNVPAGHDQLRVFKEALTMLPEGVTKVYLRSDTAGYQHDLLKYCEKGENKRFGRIEFAMGCDVTKAFKAAVAEAKDWKPVMKEITGKMRATGAEWAEVCFVPDKIACTKNAPVYRYVATRELLAQPELPGMEGQLSLPFPAMTMENNRYKVFGIVTNRDMDGSELVAWLHDRCGKSEEAHAVMKEDLAGGRLPSGKFGENAAWWGIMVLAFNLTAALKRLILQGSWVNKRIKALRFSLIALPGRVMTHARELVVRLAAGHPSLDVLIAARQRILELGCAPSG